MFKLSIKEILFLSLSSFLTALAVRLFFIEYSLTPGGITGLSITLSSLLQLPIDLISLCISIPLLLISFFILGNKFVFKTIFVTVTNECATGGTDTIAYLIRHILKKIELSKIIFVIDMIIVLSSFLISKQIYTSIYSSISLIVIVITIHFLTKLRS